MARGENRKKMIKSGGYAGFCAAHKSHISKGSMQRYVQRHGLDDVLADQCKSMAEKMQKSVEKVQNVAKGKKYPHN